MTLSFKPDPEAVPRYPWNITYLSQRDVQLTIPIPFVTSPGVSLTAACFPNRRYDDYAAAKCLSNLLVLGYRRLHVDLYWDAERKLWSFCPVQVPGPSFVNTPTQKPKSSLSTSRSSSSSSGSSPQHSVRAAITSRSTHTPTDTAAARLTTLSRTAAGTTGLVARQLGVSSASTELQQTKHYLTSPISRTTVTVTVSTASDRTFVVPPTQTPSSPTEEILYSIPPYVCTRTPALDILNQVVYNFLDITDNTVEAVIRYLIFNIHAAASPIAPDSPAQEPAATDLPSASRSLGNLVYTHFSDYLYTPATLQSQRRDLNDSWYLADPAYEPDDAYFSIDIHDGVATTPNGWPSESVMEFQSDNHRRLLVGIGTVDPQMRNYDRSGEMHLIFGQGALDDITSSCIFNPNSTALSAANNSWAITNVADLPSTDFTGPGYKTPIGPVTHLVGCGVSAFLNETLSGVSADKNPLPYREFAYSAVWSWAWGEPRAKNDTNLFRCAVLDPSAGGRWVVQLCSHNFRAACRVGNQPYRWTISNQSDEYSSARGHCPKNSHFDVPRTALENHYLLHAYLQASGPAPKPPIWIDFNSLDIQFCWVTGRNATCPYQIPNTDAAQIYVPTIAGLVIVIFAGLLVFVKCGANRRQARRRRRVVGGWDYEGVPS